MSTNGNGRMVTILLALCMFLAGVVVAGIGGVLRGDYLGAKAAEQTETRVNRRIDRTLAEINRRLERLEDRTP